MRIVRLDIENFRGIKKATVFPEKHNVYLGPNNIGKTAILEALNLLLNPEITYRSDVVDENDFFCRRYRSSGATSQPGATAAGAVDRDASGTVAPASVAAQPADVAAEPSELAPVVRITAVLTELSDDEADKVFNDVLVPWKADTREVIEGSNLGDDPFEGNAKAIRPCFEAWYDEDEDDFKWRSFFRTDPALPRDACPPVSRAQKRTIGFLIYRDFRALQRPVTLDSSGLFARLLQSQEATPKVLDDVLARLHGAASPLFSDENFARVVNEYRQELARYLPLAATGSGKLSFEVTDRTRREVKGTTQLYIEDAVPIPLQQMGAGTRSLAVLGVLLQIARKRGRGILALEEPETFLFPHAQRRIIDETTAIASQTFVTTHSPYVLERMPVESLQRITRNKDAVVSAERIVGDAKSGRHVRDRLKRQLAEALLGRGAIIVEEESVRLWILKASALLHGIEFDGTKRQALELNGISVVSAAGNGEVPVVGDLLLKAGIHAIGFLDQVTDAERTRMLGSSNVALVFHAERALEPLLAKQLPRSVLTQILCASSDYKKHKHEEADVAGWTDDQVREKAQEFLRNHKGYLPFHDEILDQIDLSTMPDVFKRLVCLACKVCDGETIGRETVLA